MYQINSKQFKKGEKVQVVPWMKNLYPSVGGKTAVIEDVSGATAKIKVNARSKPQIVDLTHLQRAIH